MKKSKQTFSHRKKDDSWKKYTKKFEPVVRTAKSHGKKQKPRFGLGRILDYALMYGLPIFIYVAMLAVFLFFLIGGIYLFCKGEDGAWLGGILCFAVVAMDFWCMWNCFGIFGFIMDDMIRSEAYYEEHSGFILEDLKGRFPIGRGRKKEKDPAQKVSANVHKSGEKETKKSIKREQSQ